MSFRVRQHTKHGRRKETIIQKNPLKSGENVMTDVKYLPKEVEEVGEEVGEVIGEEVGEVIVKRNCIVEKDHFTLGEETVVYDEVYGIWKIKD